MKQITSLASRAAAGLSRYRAQVMRSFVRVAIVILVLAIAVSGYLYWQKVSFNPPMARTEQGQLMEALLPENSNLVFSYNPTDADERARFATLWDTILQDKKDALLPLIAQEFTTANDFNLSLEDMLAIFGENFSFVMALEDRPVDTYNMGATKLPEFYFIFSTQDSARALTILENNKNKFNGKIQFGVTGDVAFITNAGDEKAGELVARSKKKNPAGSLVRTQRFRESISRFKQPFSGYLFTMMTNNSLFMPAIVGDFSAVRSSAISIHAEANGLRFQTHTLGDKKLLADSGTSLVDAFKPYSAHLYKKIPGDNAMLFTESHHMGSLIESQLGILGSAASMMPENLLAQFETATGFNFHDDIVPFINEGFVVNVQDKGGIIPAVSFFIDANAEPEKATMVVRDLDFHVPDWIAYANLALQSTEEEPIIEMDNFKEIGTGASVKIHLDRLPKSTADIPLFDLTGTIEISYGLTLDNILFFSMIPNFEGELKAVKTVENNEIFQELLASQSAIGSFAVIDGKALGNYVGRIVEIARARNSFSASNEEAFAILQKHLAPIKGFFQNDRGDGLNIFGEALLEISR